MLGEQHRPVELWTDGVEQAVIDDMIIFQKPFPGAARTELDKHVKCKMDLERCLFWDPAGNRAPRPTEFARRRGRALVEARHVWLMARHGTCSSRCATLCWSPWRRHAARSRPPAARSSWPARRPRTGGAA